MTTDPLTPQDEPPANGMLTNMFDPSKIPYTAAFEDAVMQVILNPPPMDGIQREDEHAVAAPSSPSNANGSSTHLSLPTVPFSELPLPLSDPRRRYQSPVAGIRLTHPGGWLEGGPGPELGERRAFALAFAARYHGVRTPEELRRRVADETRARMQELAERMRARQDAIENNARVERDMAQLVAQRETERRVEKRLVDETRLKRERRRGRHGQGK